MDNTDNVNKILEKIGMLMKETNADRKLRGGNIIDISYVLSPLRQYLLKNKTLVNHLVNSEYEISIENETMENGFSYECLMNIFIPDNIIYQFVFNMSNIYALEWCPCELEVKEIKLIANETYNGDEIEYKKYKERVKNILYKDDQSEIKKKIKRMKEQITILEDEINQLKEILI